MKVSLKWLKEYVDVAMPAATLAEKLTLAGFEVKDMEAIGGNWDNIVIGQITAINPHPNADRLTLPSIDLGISLEAVVCGAPNLRIGDKIAFARVGAKLIDGHSGQSVVLQQAKIRGVVSSGMVCSEKELGISDRHEGIMVLPPDAPVGMPLSDYLGDVVFNLEITPNRPDCLSVLGIAMEIAALTGQDLRLPDVSYEESEVSIDRQITVEITAPELCPRYCASLITGVKVAESPEWLQQRLLACGLRPINNIVDVTNYVMLEYGQPSHSFDYDRIKGKRITVRRAVSGEKIITLDGEERDLSGDMLVVADAERPVALAGIMGGANSEITPETTSVLLEAASWNPANVHYTGRTLRLPSEACMRFERGISRELALPALRRATQLLVQLSGGKAAKGVVDVYPGKRVQEPILLSTGEVKRFLGIGFSLKEMVAALTSLGFECQPASSTSAVLVTAPYWRSDIHLAVDLVEEIARIRGYHSLPTTMLNTPIPHQNPEPIIRLKRELRQRLMGYGFQELVTYSLTSLAMLNKLLPESQPLQPVPLRLLNPMTAEMEYLRPNLRANLLSALSLNRRHEDGEIRLFELGKVYRPVAGDLPVEAETLCGLLSGAKIRESWQGGDKTADFFEVKGVTEALFNQLGITASFEPGSDESLHPAKQLSIVVGGSRVGVLGELHPKVLESFDLAEAAFLFEIELAALAPVTLGHKMFQPIPRFPAIVRDMALVVSAETTHRKIVDIIKGFSTVNDVVIFDVYSGGQIPSGKKSMAYRLTFQSPTHTLTDEEVDKVQQQILGKLSHDVGATLRS